MKLAPVLLLNLLLVGGGIFLYDALKGAAPASSDAPLAGAPAAPGASGGLTGSADRKAAHSSEARIRSMEAAIASLQAELEALRTGKGVEKTADDDPTAPVQIDEKTLRWMTAYRHEIVKREGEARIRARMAVEFERKGVALPANAMERVVRETLAFHERGKALIKTPREPGMEGRALRTRQIRELRNEYERILRDIAPAEQVELILATAAGRARRILPSDDDAD